MRRYTGRPAAAAAVTGSASDPEAGKPLDHHPLAGLGVREVDEILHLRLTAGVLDEHLLEQTLIREELLQLAPDDLVEHLGRLLLVRHLATVDLALLLQHGRRHLVARDVGRAVGGHQETSASAAAISLSSPSSVPPAPSSLPRVPRPSLTASAMREVMSRTARMASSLPGTA